MLAISAKSSGISPLWMRIVALSIVVSVCIWTSQVTLLFTREQIKQHAELIIQDALALAPYHPDILIEYGVIVKMRRKNVVEAEELYSEALSYNPHHPEALVTRAKTLPIMEKIDEEMLKKLHEKRSYFLRISKINTALRKPMK